MQRTWVVYVQMNCGHELNNTTSEADWYGPFTREQAEKLEVELNAIFDKVDEEEHEEAVAMPLFRLSPREIKRKYRGSEKSIGAF